MFMLNKISESESVYFNVGPGILASCIERSRCHK